MNRFLCIPAATLIALALLTGSAAGTQDEFLPPGEAFRSLAESDGSSVKVRWNVAPGYYLYKSRMSVGSATRGITVGEARYPAGEIHHDEYFGDQEIFRDDFVVTAPISRADVTTREIVLTLKLQGCADAGLCYPPQVREIKVALPAPVK